MKKFEQERMEYIETRLLWGEGLTAGGVGEAFDLSRPVAQKSIDTYRRMFPDQMEYDASKKCHVATSDFKSRFIKPDPLKFLDYLRGETLVGYYKEEREWSDFEVEDVSLKLRHKLDFKIVKRIFSALLRKQTLFIEYKKKELEVGERTERVISPNHLVFAENRYHVRAYCHLRHQFRDFVLSRIEYADVSSDEEWIPSDEDRDWNERVTLSFRANPVLPQSVQQAIICNYDTEESGVWCINCRKAMAYYIKKALMTPDKKFKKPLWVNATQEAG
jgi:predicted DNA-binding transcriptional regulator YafY